MNKKRAGVSSTLKLDILKQGKIFLTKTHFFKHWILMKKTSGTPAVQNGNPKTFSVSPVYMKLNYSKFNGSRGTLCFCVGGFKWPFEVADKNS